MQSLRFGASAEVNFGKGCKAKSSEKAGDDLIVTFDAAGNGITAEEFAPKLIGQTTAGSLLYGYARLPYIDYLEPALSALAPIFTQRVDVTDVSVEVQNFGQVASREATLQLTVEENGKDVIAGVATIPPLKAYEKTTVFFPSEQTFEKGSEYKFTLTIRSGKKEYLPFRFKRKL
jgi:hypothetical protein